MLHIFLRSLTAKQAGRRYPADPETPPPAFRGMPELREAACRGEAACSQACPTAALQVERRTDGWSWRLDRAACTACGLCIEACPQAAIASSPAFELAARSRADLVCVVSFRTGAAPRDQEQAR